jgi:dipeptidyl aminopeptidase/acylaminoacyl peptidase
MSLPIGDRAPYFRGAGNAEASDIRASGLEARRQDGRAGALVVGCAALLLLAGLLSARTACAVPLEAYGHLPQIEDVSLSPDGLQIAFVRTEGDTRVIWVGPLADATKALPIKVGDEKLRAIGWADNSHVLMEMSGTTLPAEFCCARSELFQLQVIDVATRKSTILPNVNQLATGNGLHWLNVISGSPMVRILDGHTVLFIPGAYFQTRLYPALFRVDLATGAQQMIKRGVQSDMGWLVGGNGEILAEEEYFEMEKRWVLLARVNGNMTEVASGHEAIDLPRILGFGPEPDTLLIQELENGINVWKLLSLRDGKLGAPLDEHRSFYAPIEDLGAHRMVGGAYIDDHVQYVFFDPQLQKRWDMILQAFSGEHVRFVSSSRDLTKMVVLVEGARHGFTYFVVDLGTGQVRMIGPVYNGITQLFEVRRINYPAQDGFVVPAYLTLPSGRAQKSLPLVVLPHGGPAARDTAEFDWWSQALADQGYAVLQPNYRGSDLGRTHLEAGFGQFGRKMQTDLSDGVRYLVKDGIVDPARVCIVGASYGGYAALAGVTLDPGVYRCAVSLAGPSDLKRMLSREGWGRAQRYWDRFMGVAGPGDPVLDAISPIKHIDAINVPVLLIHGRDDTVVPFEQSEVMFDAMKRAKKDVELVKLNREDHWLSRGETRTQMLQTSVQFLRAHNPPD